MPPRISVVMGVYNAEAFLRPAIDSLLSQTYFDFELITVNDGSTDSTADILQYYAQKDHRVHRIDNDTNHGHAYSLNRGIGMAEGEYVAHMDADDICLPNRFDVQVAYMDAHPKIGVCGSWVELIGDRTDIIWKYPLEHQAIRTRLLFKNPMAHPTVIFRRDIFARQGLAYPENHECSEDYHFWARLAEYTRFANIPQVLVKYRRHADQISSSKKELQRKQALIIHRLLLARLHILPTEYEEKIYDALSSPELHPHRDLLDSAETWFINLIEANKQHSIYPEDCLWNEVSSRWTVLCDRSDVGGDWLFWKVLRSPLGYNRSKSLFSRLSQDAILMVKSLARRMS